MTANHCPAIAGVHLFAITGVCRNCGYYDQTKDLVDGHEGERAL